jgi:hypothetical protein
MNPYVKSAQTMDDYCLLLTFENGENRVFDLTPYFDKPIFSGLKNIALFKTARVVSGSVEWQGEIDLSYDTLYLESKAVHYQRKPVRTRNASMPVAVRGKKLTKTRVASK